MAVTFPILPGVGPESSGLCHKLLLWRQPPGRSCVRAFPLTPVVLAAFRWLCGNEGSGTVTDMVVKSQTCLSSVPLLF